MCVKKNVWNPRTFACEINRYLKRTAFNLVITCDEIIGTDSSWVVLLPNKNYTSKF